MNSGDSAILAKLGLALRIQIATQIATRFKVSGLSPIVVTTFSTASRPARRRPPAAAVLGQQRR
jgi:hypothetical protein